MQIIRTISALTLALMVLVSSTSFMVGMHFCMGEVKDVSLFVPAAQCPKHQENLPACHMHQDDCCQDKVVLHDGDDFKNNIKSLEFGTSVPLQLSTPPVLISEIVPAFYSRISAPAIHAPPLLYTDITIDHQVFRI
jgi:hypothetical protein